MPSSLPHNLSPAPNPAESARAALARHNVSDLSLDSSFDGDGYLTTSFGANNDAAYGVAIGADGRIVAAGVTTPTSGGTADFAVARYKLPSGLEQRRFAQHDPSYNITSITDANGQIAERYEYQPHGGVTEFADRSAKS